MVLINTVLNGTLLASLIIRIFIGTLKITIFKRKRDLSGVMIRLETWKIYRDTFNWNHVYGFSFTENRCKNDMSHD